MKIISQDEFLKGGNFKVVSQPQEQQPQSAFSDLFAVPTPHHLGQAAKDVAIGAGKGVLEGAIAVGRGAYTAGQGIQAALDPKRSFSDIRQATDPNGIFSGKQADRIDQQLTSTNSSQTTGKVLQAVGSLIFPVGATKEVSTLLSKGKQATGATFDGIGSRLNALSDDTVEGTTRIKEQVMDALTNLDDKTKTALKRTPQDVFEKFVKQGQDAMLDDRNRTPLESVGDEIIAGLQQIKNRANQAGQLKSQIMEQANVGYKKAGNIAQRSALNIQKAFSGKQLDASDKTMVSNFQKTLQSLGDNPSLREIDATIDLLQDQIYKKGRSNVIEVTDRVTGALRRELSALNSQVKQMGGKAYAKANADYSELIETVNELNARLGKEGSSAGSFVKRLFSPSDARTKELFDKLQELTGKDYIRDARLAKFIMETLGDSRAKSLLEQLPNPTPSGIIGKGVEFVKDKLSDPIDAARRFIEKQAKENGQAFAAAPLGLTPDENGDIQPEAIFGALAAGFVGKVTPQKKAEAKKTLDRLYKHFIQLPSGTAKKQAQKAYREAFDKYQKWTAKGRR